MLLRACSGRIKILRLGIKLGLEMILDVKLVAEFIKYD